jgi:hypothetical protein
LSRRSTIEQAERAALGCILINNNSLDDIRRLVERSSFTSDDHGTIYEAMLELAADYKEIDLLTVLAVLRLRHPEREWTALVAGLIDGIPDVARAHHYAQIMYLGTGVGTIRQESPEDDPSLVAYAVWCPNLCGGGVIAETRADAIKEATKTGWKLVNKPVGPRWYCDECVAANCHDDRKLMIWGDEEDEWS